MGWQDISVPIRPGMPTFEGDPTVQFERVMAIADGARRGSVGDSQA